MKFQRIIAIVLAMLMICSMFVACGSNEDDKNKGKDDETLVQNPSVTLNIKIKNGTKVVSSCDNYTYRGRPRGEITNEKTGKTETYITIKQVVDWYCTIDAEETMSFKTADDGSILQIGDMKAGSQSDGYHYFKYCINGVEEEKISMNDYKLQDGEELWIVYDCIKTK